MNKKILVTSTELMMLQFLIPHINNLIDNGLEVELACSEVGGRFEELKNKFCHEIQIYKIELSRSPYKLNNYKGFRQLCDIIRKNKYDMIWTNEPVMGAVTRMAAHLNKNKGCKVLYMTHGFHFYEGAPLRNWVFYYSIEKILSYITDVLVTINKEDYGRAKKNFRMRKLFYIHGIGLDTRYFSQIYIDRNKKRKEIGISQDAFVLFSVGELSDRKNHQVVIEALGKIHDLSIYYVIAGKGKLFHKYQESAQKYGISQNIILLGFRKDIGELCKMADVFIHPSAREGLGIAPLEAMACGLPLINTKINGMKDYTKDGVTGCCIENPHDIKSMENAIQFMRKNKKFRENCVINNQKVVQEYDIEISKSEIKKIIMDILNTMH